VFIEILDILKIYISQGSVIIWWWN